MPKYNVVGDTLLEAITRLVHAVTEDAIKDEAREWQNVQGMARRDGRPPCQDGLSPSPSLSCSGSSEPPTNPEK
jgi:hypothetical protein